MNLKLKSFFEPSTSVSTSADCPARSCVDLVDIDRWEARNPKHYLEKFANPTCTKCYLAWSILSSSDVATSQATLYDLGIQLLPDINTEINSMSIGYRKKPGAPWTIEKYVIYNPTGTHYLGILNAVLSILEKHSLTDVDTGDGDFYKRSHIITDPLQEHLLSHIQQLLKTCQQEHDACPYDPENPPSLPTRVLDLSDGSVKLLESQGKRAFYAALSYCWGGAEFITSATTSIEAHKTGITIESLPQVFLDAIRIARDLGLQYSWINSLCVLQDSPEDWQLEASRMAQVYSNSYITLAASRSPNPHQGFLTPRRDRINIENVLRKGALVDCYAAMKLEHKSMDLRHPLSTRGWAYQEHQLSKRVLFFKQELSFQCLTTNTCECIPIQQKTGILSKITQNDWTTEVDNYSQLALTYPLDRLPAFSGIAQRYSELGYGKYLAGLWERHLPDTLFWQRYRYRNRIAPLDSLYIAPSWSWAAHRGPIQYYDWFQGFMKSKWKAKALIFIDSDCKPIGIDPFGAIASGFVKVRGKLAPCSPVTFWRGIYYDYDDNGVDGARLASQDTIVLGLEGTVTTLEPSDTEPRTCYRCLILKQSDKIAGAFERIGLPSFGYDNDEAVAEDETIFEESEVMLI